MNEEISILKGNLKCFLIVILLIFLTACTPDKSVDESVIEAKKAIKTKQWASALIHLKSALSEHNKLSLVSKDEIRFLLGKVYLAKGNMLQAERFLLPVVSENFQLQKSISMYARSLFHQDKFGLLNSTIEQYEAKAMEPNIELSLYKVLLLHKTDKQQQARDLLGIINEQSQDSAFFLYTQAYLHKSESPKSSAILIEQLINIDPSYVDAYLLKGQLYLAQKDFNTAYKAFKAYLHLQPSAYHIHFWLAISALQLENNDIAQEHVAALLQINKNHALANHLQALLAFEKKRFSAAKAHAERSINSALSLPSNYLIAGVSALRLDQEHQAYQHLSKAAKSMPENKQVQKMLVLIQLKLGYLQDATTSFENLTLASNSDFSLGNMLASQLLSEQDSTSAQAVLNKLKQVPVDEPALKVQQGILQLRSGDNGGLAILEQVSKQTVSKLEESGAISDMSRVAFIMALADRGQLNKAIGQAQKWHSEAPKNIHVMNILALLCQKNKESENALLWYQKALMHDPQNIPSLLFLAYRAAGKKDIKRAGNLFLKILAIKPNHVTAFDGLLKLTLQVTDTPHWQSIQSIIDVSNPQYYKEGSVLLKLAKAMYQAQAYEELHQYLLGSTEQKFWSNGLWRLWLQVQAERNDETEFEDALIKFNRLYFDEVNQLFLISLLEKEHQLEKILDVIKFYNDQQSPSDKGHGKLQYAKANALLSLNKIKQAEFLIKQLEVKMPLPALSWLQGRLALVKNDEALAQELFEIHFSKQPTLPGLMQLAPLYIKLQESDKLLSLGNRYLSAFSNDCHARMLLNNWLTKVNKTAAISILDKPQCQLFISRNWQVANNLAWLYLNTTNKKNALTFSSLAIAIQPQHKDVVFTHAVALLIHKENDRALKLLRGIKQPNNDIKQLIAQLHSH